MDSYFFIASELYFLFPKKTTGISEEKALVAVPERVFGRSEVKHTVQQACKTSGSVFVNAVGDGCLSPSALAP